jgi:hypothetical protein
VKEAQLEQRQFDKYDPNWLSATIESNMIADET